MCKGRFTILWFTIYAITIVHRFSEQFAKYDTIERSTEIIVNSINIATAIQGNNPIMVDSNRLVVVEFLLKKPCWCLLIRLYYVTNIIYWLTLNENLYDFTDSARKCNRTV